MADTRTPASRRAASSASATRLPSARERRPALAALAVLLIVGGAFASGFLALQAGNRADFLRLKASVAQGEEITDTDLESVSLPEDMDGVISVDDRDDVVGLHAKAPLLSGTILTEDMVTEDSGIPEGQVKIAIGVDANDLNPDLQEGAAVTVYATSEEGEDTDDYDATVVSVNTPDGDGGIGGEGGSSTAQVLVLMDAVDAQALQPALQDDRVSIGEVAPPPPDDSTEGSEGGE
jgi:SAF domain